MQYIYIYILDANHCQEWQACKSTTVYGMPCDYLFQFWRQYAWIRLNHFLLLLMTSSRTAPECTGLISSHHLMNLNTCFSASQYTYIESTIRMFLLIWCQLHEDYILGILSFLRASLSSGVIVFIKTNTSLSCCGHCWRFIGVRASIWQVIHHILTTRFQCG